jgi:phosphohistidine swiveling domain-containing protein
MGKINIKKIHPGIKWMRTASRGRLHAIIYMDNVGLGNINRFDLSVFKINCPGKYYRQLDGSRWISELDFKNITAFYKKSIKHDPAFFSKIADTRAKANERLKNFALRQTGKKWKEMSDEKLIDILEKWQYLEGAHWGGVCLYGYYIYVNDIFLFEFKKYLENKLTYNFDDVWNYILSPSQMTEIGKEKIDLLKLALVSLKKPINDAQMKQHANKYAFTNKYYFWGDKLDAKKVKENLNSYRRKGQKFIEAEIEKMRPKKIDLGKYNLSKNDITIIEGIRKISSTYNQNDDVSNYTIYLLDSFFKELAARLNLTYEEVVSMRGVEIKRSIRSRKLAVDRSEIKLRLKDHAIIFAKKKIFILSGKELEEYKKQELKEKKFKIVQELKGSVANPGKIITGRVRIIDSDTKVGNFKDGEILVTQMTNPAFVPAMKKAKAIITDEGGLLCHAAIVSRELGVPCIIGTKIATKILKDGEIVEVNANSGIVRKIK